MSATPTETSATDRDLHLSRCIDAPREKVYRAWTEPELLRQWFTPRPWIVTQVETDVRPGGASLVVMCSPEGLEFPSRGVYLEVVPNRRLVFTDAYTYAWEPAAKPFMTVILTFDEEIEGEGERTRYTALVRHWTTADREAHEKMGFHEGWAKATDQLAELAASL